MSEYSIDDFYHDMRQDVLAGSEARQDFLEAEFLQNLATELEESGIIDGFEPCQYRAARGMRVDGYWFREDEDCVDVFIVDFENREQLESLTRTEAGSIFKRLENFVTASLDKKLFTGMEESSPGYGLSRDLYDRRGDYSKVNMFLITERRMSERIQEMEDVQNGSYRFV